MPTPYLDFYYKFAGKKLPDYGLCNCFKGDDYIKLFTPLRDDIQLDGTDNPYSAWGCENRDYSTAFICGPFRQNVLLFCACITNEL